MLKKLLLSCLTLSIGFSANWASAQQYATAIFDNTGSMQAPRTDGKTRCQYGKELFLKTIEVTFSNSNYINVKFFAEPGRLTSISNGFYDITGLKVDSGPGKVFYDNIAQQVNALRCDGVATALGDAVCDSTDELRNALLSNNITPPRLAVVTDAGENASVRCGGGVNTYVATHIEPRLANPAPKVRLNLTVLTTPGGNVLARLQSAQQFTPSLEIFPTSSTAPTISARSANQLAATAPIYSTEVQALVNAATASGGGAIVIPDNKTCTSKCDPMSQEPDDDWGGAW